ncbi:MAG: hypothetical protein ACREEW_18900 [Caulobacteraceae bacterium]
MLRILFFAAWAATVFDFAAMITLQGRVLASPNSPSGAYLHAVTYKGEVFYLTASLGELWSALQSAALPLWCAMAFLLVILGTLECRLKRRLLDDAIDGLIGRE